MLHNICRSYKSYEAVDLSVKPNDFEQDNSLLLSTSNLQNAGKARRGYFIKFSTLRLIKSNYKKFNSFALFFFFCQKAKENC